MLKIEPMKGKGGALDWVGLLSDDALKAIKNWDDDLKAALHADLKASDDLVKELAKKPELVEGWKKMHELGFESAVKSNPVFMEKVEFFISKGLTDSQIKKIVKTKKPKNLEIAENCLKRTPPYTDYVHNLVIYANKLEYKQAGALDKIKILASDSKFLNIEQLKDALSKGLSDIESGSKGIFTEIDEAVRLIQNGKKVKLGFKNKVGEELDVVNVTDNWVVEIKNVSSPSIKGFNSNLKKIADKFNDPNKLSVKTRLGFETGGGLKGKLEISNSKHPFYNYNQNQLRQEIQAVISGVDVKYATGFARIKEIRIKNGVGEFVFTKGIDF